MAVNKEANGTWTVQCWYRNWVGERHKRTKRGFRTKTEACKWEREFLLKASGSPEMTFSDFLKVYEEDVAPRLKLNTWKTKKHIIDAKILPYFKDKKLSEITPADILAWQTELMSCTGKNGNRYSKTYLRTVNNAFATILNHAVRYYGLESSPMRKVGKIGSAKADEMKFWTKDEYLAFLEAVMDKPTSFAIFEVLYWTGVREGEALALTPGDFDFEKGLLHITKSYQRIDGKDVVTSPKTEKSNRVIAVPDFVSEEIADYIDLEGREEGERIFPVSKSYLYHEMNRGCESSGVKRIRIHDLRHSHVSMLIELGFNVLAIANRLGHESTDITFRYAHMLPSTQGEMARALSNERMGTR